MQSTHSAAAGGAFYFERIAVIAVVRQQRADDECVERHPDGAAPVAVAAEHASVGFGRQIVDSVLLITDVEDIRTLFVIARQRTNAKLAEEFVFVEHLGK